MYLIDCIHLAAKYYPSEYEEYEMIIWCNEVTALLAAVTDGEYRPVRLPRYKGYTEFGENYFTTDFPVFLKGDTVNISVDGGEYEYSEIPIIGKEYENGKYILSVPDNTFTTVHDSENVEITRCITDKTYCDPPYDTMYTYYILAKIWLLQHDIDMYNQYMSMFNSLFEMYKLSRLGKRTHNRLVNWWRRK